jgi:3-oxoacyl-[acyl-carrier protein] reductase
MNSTANKPLPAHTAVSESTKNYAGKTVVITGSSRGVGKSLALYFLSRGAQVIGLSRKEGSITHEKYQHYSVSVSDAKEVQATFVKIAKAFPRIDILINNAAVLTSRYSLIMPAANAQAMVDTNILGTFYVSRECAKIMQKSKFGRIINIGSMASALEPMGDSIYSACKAATISMAAVMAKEYASFQVTCNTVAITAIETDMLAQLPRDKIDEIIQKLPVPRYATEEDVFNVIDFFSSERSSYISAQTIFLGGIS